MSQSVGLAPTRRSLHAVAELILAGPQHTASDTVRLRVSEGGFGTVATPDLRVRGGLVVAAAGETSIDGRTARELAAACGVTATSLDHVYGGGPKVPVDEVLVLDDAAVRRLVEAFELGDAALRVFAPDERAVLWPEHFDVAVTVGRVNYGVSPGDAHRPVPYAYVGPWEVPEGKFWNEPFGAARDVEEFSDVGALVAFFGDGQRLAGG